MHIYANEPTTKTLLKDFNYAFAVDKYRGVPVIELHTIDEKKPFEVKGIKIVPIVGNHSSRFRAVGYRIGKLAYITDFSAIADEEVAKLEGAEVMVVNALRWERHDSHFSVAEATELIRRIAPREAYLTHMSHGIGLYEEASKRLEKGIHMAYDGLQIEIK
jgi:phosphoribosyl 1,2-cyclic phosphate phosphodiesterase